MRRELLIVETETLQNEGERKTVLDTLKLISAPVSTNTRAMIQTEIEKK